MSKNNGEDQAETTGQSGLRMAVERRNSSSISTTPSQKEIDRQREIDRTTATRLAAEEGKALASSPNISGELIEGAHAEIERLKRLEGNSPPKQKNKPRSSISPIPEQSEVVAGNSTDRSTVV